jgi:iron complex transport system ATP-binding protein
MSEQRSAVEVRDVTVHRGGRIVLDAMSLPVPRGEILALVGPNGAGKSTLISAIAGELRASQGEILLLDEPVQSRTVAELARLRSVYSAGQTAPPGFTAREVVEMGRWSVDSSGKDEDAAAIAGVMRLTETTGIADREFAALSEGERARVVLSRVFAQATPVLLLDEPTASLDVRHQHLVMHHLRQFASQGRTVIVAVHDLNLACMYADRIAMIRSGRIEALGTPGEVITSGNLEAVFDCPMAVLGHPTRSIPVVLPLVDPASADAFYRSGEEVTG